MPHDEFDEFWAHALQNLCLEYNAGGVTVVPPHHTTGWRVLPYMLVMQPTQGPCDIEFEDRETVHLETRETLCVAAGVAHNIRSFGAGENVSRWTQFVCYVFHTVPIGQLVEFPLVLRGDLANHLGDLNAALAQTFKVPGAEAALRRSALLLELLSHCLSAATPRNNLNVLGDWLRLVPVLRFIEENLHRPLDRDQLARHAHLSPSRFGAVFRTALGMAPGLYVQHLQIQRARALLLNTELGVAEIAEQCGQKDSFHFSRLFKKYSGISPAYYRSRVRQGLI